MNNPHLNKIIIDDISIISVVGILNMCANPTEFVSFYENSVIGEFSDFLSYKRMFFMTGSERVVMFDNILKDEGIYKDCTLGTSSKLKEAYLNPPFSRKYKGLFNFFKRRTTSREKRANFYGLFSLSEEVKCSLNKYDTEEYLRFSATNCAYVENIAVSSNFYTLMKKNELNHRDLDSQYTPNSLLSYELPNGSKSGLFYFENDIVEIFKIEKVKYNILKSNLTIEDGVVLKEESNNPLLNNQLEKLTMPVVDNKFIRNKEETLYVLIYALQDLILKDLIQPQNSNEKLLDEVTKIKTKTQLARYLSHYAHSDIDGLSLPTIKNIFAVADRLSEYKKNDPKYFFLQLIKVLKDTVLKITYCIQEDQVNECFGIFNINNLSELSEYFHKHESNKLDEVLSDVDLINKTLNESVNKFNNL